MHFIKSFKYFALSIILGLISNCLQAQPNESSIKGYVYNPDNEPAMYSTVMLMNKDTVLVKGAFSQEDGSFLFDRLQPGTYYVQIRNIEFRTYLSNPIVLKQNEKYILDHISLLPANYALDEVVVTAEKALVEVHADKVVFNVSSSINASGNSGLELLAKAPGVVIDLDNNVVLQGKSGVRIFINGRPTRLAGNDLSNFLEGMRSDNIESIEIITNPSSKYDAEGTAGIINIVLKKNVNQGFNGNLISSFSQGDYSRASLGTALNYSADKLIFNANISATEADFPDSFIEIGRQSGFILDKSSISVANRRGYNVSTGLDYTINKQHSVGIDGRAFLSERARVLRSSTGITDSNNLVPTEILMAETLDNTPSGNYMMNMYYKFVPGSSSSLSADVSLGKFSSSTGTEQPNSYFDAGMNHVIRSVNNRYDTDTSIDLWSALLDYEKKFKSLTVSAGAKHSYIRTANELAFYNILGGNPVFDLNRSNEFSYLENVSALYVILSARPTAKIALNAGLRMENTSSLGRLESQVDADDSEVKRNYTNLFPNVSISYDSKKNSVITASVGRRITRPNYQDLNPFESRMSELSTWKGNPFLRPNYINNYQITYAWKRRLIISNTYSETHDFFANLFIIDGEKGNMISPRNLDKATNNGISVSFPYTLFKWWEFASFFNYNYLTYKGSMEGTVIDLKANTYNFRVQNIFRLPAGITAELTYYRGSPWIWGGSVKVEGYQGLNFGIRKDFLNRKLLVQLTGNDIFRGNTDFYYTSNYGGIVTDGVRSFDNQRFGFSLTYNFGNQQAKARRNRSAMDEEMRRISE